MDTAFVAFERVKLSDNEVVILACCGVAFALTLLVYTLRTKRSKSPWPVVPNALPLVGQFFNFPISRFHKILEEWAEKYGQETGVYEFSYLGTRIIVACREDTVMELMKQRPNTVHRPVSETRAFNSFAPGLFSAEGDQWRADRRVVAPAFNHQNVASYLATMKIVIGRLVDKWSREVGKVQVEGLDSAATIVINGEMTRMTCDVISLVAFNADFDTLNNELGSQLASDLSDMLSKYAMIRALSPFPYWNIPIIGQYLDGAGWTRRRLHDEVGKIVDDYSRKLNEDQEEVELTRAGTFLFKMISLNKNSRGSSTAASKKRSSLLPDISHERLVGNLLTMFLAGTDTSSHTLSFCLWKIASDQTKLQEELAMEARSMPTIDDITIEDIYTKAPRIRSVIHEVLRVLGPAPNLALSNAHKPARLARMVLPPGDADLYVLTRYISTHPTTMGGRKTKLVRAAPDTDPRNLNVDQFNPRRWLNEVEGESSDIKAVEFVDPPKSVMPFGHGVRICPGKGLAETEMVLCLVEILRAFHLAPTEGHAQVGETAAFTNQPDRDIRLTLHSHFADTSKCAKME